MNENEPQIPSIQVDYDDPSDDFFKESFFADGDEGRRVLFTLQDYWRHSNPDKPERVAAFKQFMKFYNAGVQGQSKPDFQEVRFINQSICEEAFAAGEKDKIEEDHRTPLTDETKRLLRLLGYPNPGIRRITQEEAASEIEKANKALPRGLKLGQEVLWKGQKGIVAYNYYGDNTSEITIRLSYVDPKYGVRFFEEKVKPEEIQT